jgi:excisionase family DNA binding protein
MSEADKKVVPLRSQSPNMPDDNARLAVTLSVKELRRIISEEIGKTNGTDQGKLLTAEELADTLQVHKATVYEWVKSKAIPYYQSGRFVRFNLQEVLETQRKKVPPA